MKNKYLILAQSYSENDGGYIVLHKLCDQINRVGGTAFIVPYVNNFEFNSKNWIIPLLKFFKERWRRILPFKVNSAFITPVLKKISALDNLDEWIVVYPETVFGNPIKAKNVVRWFLHHPGHITGSIYYGNNELYYCFHSGINRYQSTFSKLSELELRIIHYPLNFYNLNEVSDDRKGTAYCLRKGRGKKIAHDLEGSILIDGKSHEEVSKIFKKVKRFISYDAYTAYSIFAVLCGCESVVIPDEGISENEWLPNSEDRNGLAYGFENVFKATQTMQLLIDKIHSEHRKNLETTSAFIQETSEFFS